MNNPSPSILIPYKKHWQRLQLGVICCYAIGVGILVGGITANLWMGGTSFFITAVITALIVQPWALTLTRISEYIDQHLDQAEYSSQLLLSPPAYLSGLAQLQQHKVQQQLAHSLSELPPKVALKRALLVAAILSSLGIGAYYLGVPAIGKTPLNLTAPENKITFQSVDSLPPAVTPPVLLKQAVTVDYPSYTRKKSTTTEEMTIRVVEGARLRWRLTFDEPVKEVLVEGFETFLQMNASEEQYIKAYRPTASAYYNFRFTDTMGNSYASDLFALTLQRDEAPSIETDQAPFTTFAYDALKNVPIKVQISDDFGIGSAQIIATVSSGDGESVKFREERLAFDQPLRSGTTNAILTRQLNLDTLEMVPGDELYFYIEASDEKTPVPNKARSETFFAVIQDTLNDDFAVAATMGADLMPDYFRSQRQLIIDTEKLIASQPSLEETVFKATSNNLGFDQKALRLKYGQFMGDEADSGIAVEPELPEEALDPEDPTAGYTHDHDGANEHNLVDHAHDEGGDTEEDESMLEQYLHNHDDPEESTLFTESLRSKLQQAMAAMWDAELQLRVYTPRKSLPYQYRALTLLQEIKNSARIYVHRIGFDPPPIKEETRLTGDIESVDHFYKQADLEAETDYPFIRGSIQILETRLQERSAFSTQDREAFAKAGQELARLAIDQPGRYLDTLQQLKWLSEPKGQSRTVWKAVLKGLLKALPQQDASPQQRPGYRGVLEQKVVQKLADRDG